MTKYRCVICDYIYDPEVGVITSYSIHYTKLYELRRRSSNQ